jgi:dihydroflavonol-4-reductase
MIRQITGELGNVRDAARPRANGWAGRTRPVEQTILDCARSLIEQS